MGFKPQILVADDSAATRRVLLAHIAKLGGAGDGVANGEDAVVACCEKPYDAIILDLAMPGMDGIETAHVIRNAENPNVDTPLIALTAQASDRTRNECLNAGFNAYVTKPLSRDKLSELIETFLAPGSRTEENLATKS